MTRKQRRHDHLLKWLLGLNRTERKLLTNIINSKKR